MTSGQALWDTGYGGEIPPQASSEHVTTLSDVPGVPRSRNRRVLAIVSVAAGAWIARSAWRRMASASEAFSGSPDTWPPVVRARTVGRGPGA